MAQGRQYVGWVVAITTGVFSVGCFSNKNKDVAENAAAPPPSAYPVGSESYAATTSADGTAAPGAPTAPAPAAGSGYGATASAPAPSSQPAPFALREGEQLVPHAIVSGDSLSSLAGKYNTSISRIQAANGMTDTKIYAGKTLQIPTMAVPSPLAMNGGTPAPAAASSAPAYPGAPAPAAGAYPSIAPVPPSAPTVPAVPTTPYPSGGIAAPPVPSAPNIAGSASIEVPANPASTSYPREGAIPAPPQPGGSYPVPSFEGSRIQFGQ